MHAHLLLKQAREQAGLTLDAVAKQIGITAASMSRLETGQVSLTLERVEALATIYGISIEALVTGSLVTRPTSIDLERIGQVIELVQDVILERRLRPSGKKAGAVVTAVYRTEIDRIGGDPTAAFDVERHRVLVEAMFQG